jgi:type VI secretion system secreted protein VgrG
VAEFDLLRQGVTGRQAYFLGVPGTDSGAELSVVSFTATEKMGEPSVVTIELTHPQQLARADYLNRDAVFSIVAEDGAVRKFSGYIERGGLTRSDRLLRFLSGTSGAVMLPI